MAAIGEMHFTLDHVINDPAARRVAIVYTADFDGRRVRAVEMYEFDPGGKIVAGEAMYGAATA